jgi:hypothetical protein
MNVNESKTLGEQLERNVGRSGWTNDQINLVQNFGIRKECLTLASEILYEVQTNLNEITKTRAE